MIRANITFPQIKKIKTSLARALKAHFAVFGFPKGGSPLVAEGKNKKTYFFTFGS